jgi:hypothetical protein
MLACSVTLEEEGRISMAIQLTPEQEQRIAAIVSSGAYPSAEEALDAAVAAVEIAATPGFEGPPEELEGFFWKAWAPETSRRTNSGVLLIRKPVRWLPATNQVDACDCPI